MDIQALFNALSDAERRSRSNYHLTLGKLIEELSKLPADLPVGYDTGGWPDDPDSYRGYYADLAFDRIHDGGTPPTVDKLLKVCRDECLDETFTGYKGGDFVMGADTPLWVSPYGQAAGVAIIGIARDGDRVLLTTKQVD